MSRELRICPGVRGRKCGAFLSSLDRDSHPTCARCRGKICTRDMTCDFCVGWTPGQWELFTKKRTYKERKRSHPSGSVPPAPGATPRAGTSEVPQPGTSSSSFSHPSRGQDKRGGLRVHLVLCPERVPPLELDLGLARGGGGGESLDIRPLRASAPLSLQPLRELGRGRLLGRDGLPLPAPLPWLLLPAHHSTRIERNFGGPLPCSRGPIGQILSLQKMTEPRLLLPELDMRLEVLLAIFAPLRRVTARRVLALWVGRRGHPRERSIIAQVLVVDPTRLRVERMTTGLMHLIRLTLTGMTLSGQSWASSGTSTPWKSLQESRLLGARLLLHRSMG